MIKSMTGYGRSREIIGNRDIVCEVKSVNSRYLDVTVKSSRSYSAYEDRLKALASDTISRGKLEIYFSADSTTGDRSCLSLNTDYLESYLGLLTEIKKNYSLAGEITIQTVANRSEVFTLSKPDEDMEALWVLAKPVAEAAFAAFSQMRETEGEKLRADICARLSELQALVTEIQNRAPASVKAANEKMKARIADLLAGVEVDEGRLLTECAIFADKADINEELTRLESHISQFYAILKEEKPIGRKLDFLTQELNREINTIGSKANDTDMAKLVIECKSVIEKIREQIQNIE